MTNKTCEEVRLSGEKSADRQSDNKRFFFGWCAKDAHGRSTSFNRSLWGSRNYTANAARSAGRCQVALVLGEQRVCPHKWKFTNVCRCSRLSIDFKWHDKTREQQQRVCWVAVQVVIDQIADGKWWGVADGDRTRGGITDGDRTWWYTADGGKVSNALRIV